jgi:hypothetical protein
LVTSSPSRKNRLRHLHICRMKERKIKILIKVQKRLELQVLLTVDTVT